MAERRLHGLQRVLGVNALFATAYGNVGSSIYYALGLVASFALGRWLSKRRRQKKVEQARAVAEAAQSRQVRRARERQRRR